MRRRTLRCVDEPRATVPAVPMALTQARRPGPVKDTRRPVALRRTAYLHRCTRGALTPPPAGSVITILGQKDPGERLTACGGTPAGGGTAAAVEEER